MAAPGEKSFCVLEYHMSESVVTVQRAFRAKYTKDPPVDKTILRGIIGLLKLGVCARIIAAVKNIDAHVCGKNLNIVSMCAVPPMLHTSNISSC
jgi:hypothetical protein